ncbi:MAG: hypothetical protein ABSE91_03750 [Patescibacteria group bacterium]
MQPSDKNLKELKNLLDEAEEKVAAAKRILFEQVYQEQAKNFDLMSDESTGPNTIIEGVFDGEEMIDGSGKKFPVPSNYASKSKLIPGDKLKLTITADGTFIFKQIGPVDRKRMVGLLSETGGRWQVTSDGEKYHVLQASVTYFRAKSGDEVTIIVPKAGESDWAAIENCLNKKEA